MNKFDRRKIAFILLFASLSGGNTSAMSTVKIDEKPAVKSGSYSRKPIVGNAKSNRSIGLILGLAIFPTVASALTLLFYKKQNQKGTQELELNNSSTKNSEIEENKVSENLVNGNDDDNYDDNDGNQVSQVDINNINESDDFVDNNIDNNINNVNNLPENNSIDNDFNEENNDLHVNTELDNLKSELSSLGNKMHYVLGDKGRIYLSNPVREMNLDGVNKDLLKWHLKILCVDARIDSGKDAGDNQSGWKQTPWEYFFVENSRVSNADMYEELDNDDKKLLAKCIEFMYRNKDRSQKWIGYKNMCLGQMAVHGGHCEWRAEAITNTVFDMLTNFLRETGKIKSDNVMDDVFCELKDKMISDAKDNFLKEHVNSREPLLDANKLVSGLRYWLNIPGGNKEKSEELFVKRYIEEKMVNSFIRLSHDVLNKLEEYKRKELMYGDSNDISFKEYCEYTMKTPDQIKKILNKVWASDDTDAEDLKGWIKGEKKLTLGDVFVNVCSVFGYEDEDVFDLTKYYFGLRFLLNCVKNDYLWLVDND